MGASQFAETQIEASQLADLFNERVEGFKGHCMLEFVKPTLVSCKDEYGGQLFFLTEPNLTAEGHAWQKWNKNDGKVFEGSSGSEELVVSSTSKEEDLRGVKYSDFLQAFSHFTNDFTKGEYLCCDLQGVFDPERKCFRLTE